MLEILMELGLTEEEAQKVMSAFDAYLEEVDKKKKEKEAPKEPEDNEEKEEDKEKAEKTEDDVEVAGEDGNNKKKAAIAPMGKTEEDIPTKEEFEKMGYLARLELAKANPKLYEKLKNNQ